MKKNTLKIFVCSLLLGGAAAVPAHSSWVDSAFPNADNRVSRNAMVVHDGVLYLGGDFSSIGGIDRYRVAAIDLATGRVMDWDPKLGGEKCAVSAILVMDGLVYLGGSFKTVSGLERPGLVAVTPAGKGPVQVQPWAPNPDQSVHCLLASADAKSLVVGGRFTEIAGQKRERLAEISAAPLGSPTLGPLAASMDRWVASLAWDPQSPAHLLAAGGFTQVNGRLRRGLVRFNRHSGAAEGLELELEGGPNRQVMKLLVHQGLVYAGGVEIDRVNGQPRKNLFALQPGGWQLAPFRADLNAGAGALAAQGNRLYVGGDFTAVGSHPRRVAALDAQSGEVLDWDPRPNHNNYAIALDGHRVLMSGYWKDLGGHSNVDFLASVGLASPALLTFLTRPLPLP